MSLQCYKCGKELSEAFKVMLSRTDSCKSCMADLRCCKMCIHYDPKSYNDCRESMADRIQDKEKANFCDYFKIGSSFVDANKEREALLAKANALFKK